MMRSVRAGVALAAVAALPLSYVVLVIARVPVTIEAAGANYHVAWPFILGNGVSAAWFLFLPLRRRSASAYLGATGAFIAGAAMTIEIFDRKTLESAVLFFFWPLSWAVETLPLALAVTAVAWLLRERSS